MQVVSKAEFAALLGVSKARVSQYLDKGIIDAAALEGEGRSARIRVEVAREQVRQRRDITQAIVNGAAQVDAPAPVAPATETPVLPLERSVDAQLKAERLEAEQRKNRIAAREEAERAGQLLYAPQVRIEMSRLAAAINDANAAMLTDFATAIAAAYQLPQRDVLHLLRKVRREKAATVAAQARQQAGDVVAVTVADLDEAAA